MNPLIVFYLTVSAIHSVPLVVITLCLQFDAPIHFFPKNLGDRVNRGLGIAQFEEFSRALNMDTMKCMTTFSLMSCLFQLLSMTLIVFAIMFDVPLPFMSNMDEILTMDVMNDLLMFGAIVACVQLIPMLCLSLALFLEIPLPFVSTSPKNRGPPSNKMTRWEGGSDDLTLVRLTRFEDSETTYIYANCHHDRLGELFKIVVRKGKEPGAKPQYFLYTDESTLDN